MRSDKFPRTLAGLMLILALVIAACGPAAPAAPAQEAAPPAAEQVAEQPAPAATEAPAEEPAAEAMPGEEEAAFDPVAAMDEFLAAIPEGYWAIGTVEKLQEMMDSTDVLLVDVREPAEVEGGVLPGAIHIPLRELADNLDKIPTDRPVVTYCASGYRAALAMTTLEFLGYDNVRAFPPSWKGWTAAEMPTDPAPATPETYAMPELDANKVAMAQEFLHNIPEGFYTVGTVDKLKEMMDAVNPVLVDVREEKEVAENGKIPGAMNVPIRTLAANLDQIPADQPVVVYCASGYRAAMSLAALQMVGYDNVRAFPPSFKGWSAAGEPVEK